MVFLMIRPICNGYYRMGLQNATPSQCEHELAKTSIARSGAFSTAEWYIVKCMRRNIFAGAATSARLISDLGPRSALAILR